MADIEGPGPAPIGISVVDDNELVCQAVERWFGRSAEYRFLGASTSTHDAFAAIAASRPRVVLLDVHVPGSDPFALLARISAELPEVRVVMLSGHTEAKYIERALDAGAAGYIVKDEGLPVIMDLVKRASEGEIVLSPSAKLSLATT